MEPRAPPCQASPLTPQLYSGLLFCFEETRYVAQAGLQLSFLFLHLFVGMCMCVRVPSESRRCQIPGAPVPGIYEQPDAGAGN